MIKTTAIVVAMLSGLAFAEGHSIPALTDGDVLFSREYPYRTVRSTAWTLYQMARLGFSSVRDFQDHHSLTADNVIGPATQNAVSVAFQKAFGTATARPLDNSPLVMAAQFDMDGETDALLVTLSNRSANTIRIRGEMRTDNNDRVTLQESTVTARGKVDTWEDGKISLSSWYLSSVLCACDTFLQPDDGIELRIPRHKLKLNQRGQACVSLMFLDASGQTHVLTVDLGSIPREENSETVRSAAPR